VSDEEKIKVVEDFIYNDEVQSLLNQINNNVMDFNILEITGMGNQEIKHSNILGWLFDDSEHNLEYQILDSFLKEVIKLTPNKALQSYLYLANTKRDITIYREKDNIDLLIVDKSNKVVITIENKVFASERIEGNDGGQLQTYEDIINKKYSHYKNKYFIYLTIDAEEASKEKWLRASYEMIVKVIENILQTKELSTKAKIILESYIDLLKRNGIVADRELKELCEKVWSNKKYKEALDILSDNRITPIKSIFNRLQKEYDFDGKFVNLELDGIKELYSEFGFKNWYDAPQIFEMQFSYLGGRNDSIWIGFFYPDLLEQNNEKLQTLCEQIIGHKIASKKYKKEYEILSIDMDYIDNREIDSVIKEIKNKVEEKNQEIIDILNNKSY